MTGLNFVLKYLCLSMCMLRIFRRTVSRARIDVGSMCEDSGAAERQTFDHRDEDKISNGPHAQSVLGMLRRRLAPGRSHACQTVSRFQAA